MIYAVCTQSCFVKVGTTLDIERRVAELQVGCPFPLKLFAVREGDEAREAAIHFALSKFAVGGEWFKIPRRMSTVLKRLGFALVDEEPRARKPAPGVRRAQAQRRASFVVVSALHEDYEGGAW